MDSEKIVKNMDSEKIVKNMKAVLKSSALKRNSKERKKRKKNLLDTNDNSDNVISELMTKNWQIKSPPLTVKEQLEKEEIPKVNVFEKMMMSRKNIDVDTSVELKSTANDNSVVKLPKKRGRRKKQREIEKPETESDLSILDEEILMQSAQKVAAKEVVKTQSPSTQKHGLHKFFSIESPQNDDNNIFNESSEMGKKRNRMQDSSTPNTPKKRRLRDNKILLDLNKNSIERKENAQEKAEENYQSQRPKRSCSNKINYSLLSSPDKESPEKKIHRLKTKSDNSIEKIDLEVDENSPVKQQKSKATLKLAPLFLKKVPKPVIDPAIKEARRNFLLSELPANLRAPIDRQKQFEDEILSNNLIGFPLVSHIMQLQNGFIKLKDVNIFQSRVKINFNQDNENESVLIPNLLKCGTLTDSHANDYSNYVDNDYDNNTINKRKRERINDIKEAVRMIKDECKDFPVNRCFKQILNKQKISSKNNELELGENGITDQNSLYIDIFKPANFEEFLIGLKPIKSLKEFLTTWNDRNIRYEDDSEDSNSRYLSRISNKYVVLSGGNGTGKTLSVYAVANELNYEVIEINAGSKRSGKKILQDLLEATQSHRIEKRLQDEDTNSDFCHNDVVSDKKTILLIEDAELTFENDDGFISSIQQLINISKRPVILTTNDRSCEHLQKFIQHNEIIYESPEHYVTKFLSLLCLAVSNYHVSELEITQLYALNKRDLRKTINEIEFFIRSDSARVNCGSLLNLYHTMENEIRFQQGRTCRSKTLSSRKDISNKCFKSSTLSDYSTLLSFKKRLIENDESSFYHNNLMNEVTKYFEQSNILEKYDFVKSQQSISSSMADEYINSNNMKTNSRVKYTDYAPILRHICRSEKNRETTRRTNRHHYLRFSVSNNSLSNDFVNSQCNIFGNSQDNI